MLFEWNRPNVIKQLKKIQRYVHQCLPPFLHEFQPSPLWILPVDYTLMTFITAFSPPIIGQPEHLQMPPSTPMLNLSETSRQPSSHQADANSFFSEDPGSQPLKETLANCHPHLSNSSSSANFILQTWLVLFYKPDHFRNGYSTSTMTHPSHQHPDISLGYLFWHQEYRRSPTSYFP